VINRRVTHRGLISDDKWACGSDPDYFRITGNQKFRYARKAGFGNFSHSRQTDPLPVAVTPVVAVEVAFLACHPRRGPAVVVVVASLIPPSQTVILGEAVRAVANCGVKGPEVAVACSYSATSHTPR
jgi:hypothetical protein